MNITICIGISGAGKSTWATEYIKNTPNTIRINRDDIRKTIVGTLVDYYSHPELVARETLVTRICDCILKDAISNDVDVVIDNTNVDQKHLLSLVAMYDDLAGMYVKVKFFDVDINDAKRRVLKRDNFKDDLDRVKYIDKQYAQYLNTKRKIELLYPYTIIK